MQAPRGSVTAQQTQQAPASTAVPATTPEFTKATDLGIKARPPASPASRCVPPHCPHTPPHGQARVQSVFYTT